MTRIHALTDAYSSKFLSLVAAFALLLPIALGVAHQAAQIIA